MTDTAVAPRAVGTTSTTSRTRAATTHQHRHLQREAGMWVFLGSECLLFGGLISTYLLYKRPGAVAGPTPARRLRHPVHVGQLVRAADELAHHGAGRLGHRTAATSTGCALWLVTTALLGRHLHRRPGLRVHAPSYREGLGYTTNIFGSASTRSPASTASTSPSASSCCCRCSCMSLRGKLPAEQGRGRRDRRPVLALRRRRVDRDLHRRLPDPQVGARDVRAADLSPPHEGALAEDYGRTAPPSDGTT